VRKSPKPSPTESPLLFEVDPEPLLEILTALGGVPVVVQAFRSLGLPALVKEHVRIKDRQRGYDEATLVESFVILNAVGGECLDDFVRLREDAGLSQMLGHQMPSPSVARKFLYEFHEEAKVEEAKQARRGPDRLHTGGNGSVAGIRCGQSRTGAGAGSAVSGPAHRHGGPRCHDHRKPEAGSFASL
jgi:hypothetical protein